MATDRMITGSVAIFYLHNCQTRDYSSSAKNCKPYPAFSGPGVGSPQTGVGDVVMHLPGV